MSIGRALGILIVAVLLDSVSSTSAPPPLGLRATSAAGLPADTFPTFDRVLLLEQTSETSANVSIGDVDGDGRLDIVLVKGRHWPLVDRVLLGDGAGHFKPGYDLGTASDRSYSGRLVDLDRDGDLDVVISNDEPDPKLVYLNDGKGHFHVGSTFGKPEWPTRNATVADIDGDGLPDIVVANRGDSTSTNYSLPEQRERALRRRLQRVLARARHDDHRRGLQSRRSDRSRCPVPGSWSESRVRRRSTGDVRRVADDPVRSA